MTRPSLALIGLLLACFPAPPAWGWGGDGHRVVARLAELRLTDEAKAGVRELLGNATLVDVAAWADDVRGERHETGPWHYCDIPLDAAGFDGERDGRNGNNVVDAVGRFAAVLADRSKPAAERAEALKFVVHFVGDLHQPLHCAERANDRGGNARFVFFEDEPKAVSLHRVWDTFLLGEAMGKARLNVYAGALDARIRADDAKAWAAGKAVDWANESHRVAAEHAYAGVPVDGPPPRLGPDYVKANVPVVEGQLQRGGVRLAYLLNMTLGHAGAAPAATQPATQPASQPGTQPSTQPTTGAAQPFPRGSPL